MRNVFALFCSNNVQVILFNSPTFFRLWWMVYKLSEQIFALFLFRMNYFFS